MNKPQPEQISLAEFLLWEQGQTERHEWIDGAIVPYAGVSYEHSTISSNVTALFHAAIGDGPCTVHTSDRQLVPRDSSNNDLGSFYADVFVTCAPEDRTGSSAHFPSVVVEVLSEHIGREFTSKMRAYTESAKISDYLIIESATQFIHRYGWETKDGIRRLTLSQQRRGPVLVHFLGLTMTFDQIYAKTNVPALLQVGGISDDETQIDLR
jgi:Uma2 family endonuclease